MCPTLTVCDVTPRQLLHLSDTNLSGAIRSKLGKFRYGMAVFKIDYALSKPIPWKAPDCLRAATVHLGGTAEEITASESAVRRGEHAERPFVLLAQPSLFDPSRAPAGKHTAWAYCHVPHGSTVDMVERMENQIERFAPGFRDCVLARHILSPVALESMDANLDRRRHQRWRDGCRPISVSPDGALLRDFVAEGLSVLVVYAAGRGSARNVRVSRGEAGAVTSALNRNSKLSTNEVTI